LLNFKHSKVSSVYQTLYTKQLSNSLILMEMEWLHLVRNFLSKKFICLKFMYTCFITMYFVVYVADEFAEVMRKTVLHQKMPFNMDSSFIKLYFGKDKQRLINYAEFSQFLHVSISLYYSRHCGRCYSCQGSKPSI